jgi:predicted nucleotidyltransferase
VEEQVVGGKIKMEEKINFFIEKLKEIFKGRLKSCILYGSYAKGNYVKGVSDINLIVIVDNIEGKDLEEIKNKLSKYAYKNLIKPYFFSEWFLLSSSDVFPVEWLDIKENHRVIYGDDLTEKINVKIENLRIEIERKIKQLYLDFQHLLIFENDKFFVLKETLKSIKFLIPLIERYIKKKILLPEILEIVEKNKKLKNEEIEKGIEEILKFFSKIIYMIDEDFKKEKR